MEAKFFCRTLGSNPKIPENPKKAQPKIPVNSRKKDPFSFSGIFACLKHIAIVPSSAAL